MVVADSDFNKIITRGRTASISLARERKWLTQILPPKAS